MAWRDILVHFKHHKDWSPQIDVAVRLAAAHEARLTGLYTLRDVAMMKLVFGATSAAAAEAAARAQPRVDAAEQRFRDAAKAAGVVAEWQTGEGNADELLAVVGRFHDLIVVEQSDPGSDEIGWDVAESCVLSSGRPTLVVPVQGSVGTVGTRILVAWNDSRQAAAAVHAALPLIEKAQSVTVAIGRGKDVRSSVTRMPRLDIVDYLRKHNGAVSSLPLNTRDADAGEAILRAVSETGADLLVMGAYGRSAWRELVLGGATRHVLQHMRVPVLMAH
jgi:nucleotide-binding universal stress UspA family protein